MKNVDIAINFGAGVAILLFLTGFSTSKADLCRNVNCSTCADVPAKDYCDYGIWPIGEGRLYYDESPGQCRMLCSQFADVNIEASIVPSNCSYCQGSQAYTLYSIHEHLDTEDWFPQYCVPRKTCIEECGEELEGCIYTGTCASQACFKNKISGEPARLDRVTFDGPATVLSVKLSDAEGGGTESTTSDLPFSVPNTLSLGYDYCAAYDLGFSLNAFSYCEDGEPLGDPNIGVEGSRQCRAVCDILNRGAYEMVRVSTQCDVCNSADAEQYITYKQESGKICIPQSKCRSECGEEPQGCVYSGSCRSLICFSGIDSKKPASVYMRNDRGASSLISVDNEGPPISLNPPVFNNELPTPSPSRSVGTSPTPPPSPSPSQSSYPSFSPFPEPSKRPSPTPQSSTSSSLSSSEDDDEDGGSSVWPWLGPLIGVAVVAIVGGVVFTLRRRNGSSPEPPVSI